MLCDSNILIYAAEPDDTLCLPYAEHPEAAISIVTRIEVLGFQGFAALAVERRLRLEEIVASLVHLNIGEVVIQQAIALRRQKKMSLADAVIAATALVNELPLVTRNVDDFKHIAGLKLVNPFAAFSGPGDPSGHH